MGNCQVCGRKCGFYKKCKSCQMMTTAGENRAPGRRPRVVSDHAMMRYREGKAPYPGRRRAFYYRKDGSKGYF